MRLYCVYFRVGVAWMEKDSKGGSWCGFLPVLPLNSKWRTQKEAHGVFSCRCCLVVVDV